MKRIVTLLVFLAAIVLMCVVAVSLGKRNAVPAGDVTASAAENAPSVTVSESDAEESPDADDLTVSPAGEKQSGADASAASSAAEDTSEADDPVLPGDMDAEADSSTGTEEDDPSDASGDNNVSSSEPASASQGTAYPGMASGYFPAGGIAPAWSNGEDSFLYFEYQVVTVPKKILAAAAESMGLPKDSEPTDALLPAIYHEGGYRVIGYTAGYSAASTPVEFKMTRTEFFPSFFILPKEKEEAAGPFANRQSGNAREIPPPEMDEEEDGDDASDGEDGEGDDEEDEEDEEDDISSQYINSYNNLASILPFFGDPTFIGNEFFLDIRPPRIFSMESSMRKLNGFTNTDYGEWGEGQSPIFDDNSFASTLTATGGKPMIVAKSQTSNAWTLHVFFTQALQMPERLVPAAGNKLVRLDFQIVRAKWNELLVAGATDGCPGVPSDMFLDRLSRSNQLRDLYSPSFRLIPSQEPVSIQLNTRTQYVPLKWIPAQDPGIPAIPLNSESIWTGTALKAAARVFNDGSVVRLDYRFEKTSQTGWRNYGYSFWGEPEMPDPVQNRYARPRQPEPELLSGTLKLPMLDTTAFRQALYLEVGKPVLAARISNPAYQPDTLTLLFVTATVEDMP